MMTFTLSDWQEARYKTWVREHQCKYYRKDFGGRYVGACGGADTFIFVPTSIGIVQRVRCACGAELDLTEQF